MFVVFVARFLLQENRLAYDGQILVFPLKGKHSLSPVAKYQVILIATLT